ncbi:MAG: tRNA (adenosine(37)-N6)-threonylcarbamoyltransferase complex ATPase subunit type 1 TsaE [Patescibacteria group bacterium]
MISNSLEQTNQIASEFAQTLKGGEVVLMRGELGSGKTTFVQATSKALGSHDRVHSPSFTIMNLYSIPPLTKGGLGGVYEGVREIVHLDFYRLQEQPDSLEDLGLEEWFNREDVVIFIEWPIHEQFKDSQSKLIYIDFQIISENERKIEINKRQG